MAPVAAALIALTMGRLADHLFGLDDARRARDLLSRLFRARNNRFSHQFAEVAAQSGEVMGLVIAYSGRRLKSLALPTASHLIRAGGAAAFLRFLARALPLSGVREARDDEYFVNTIAVLPPYQGQGLGTYLLSRIEKTAQERGFGKLSLSVDAENLRALSLYKRVGFTVEETVSVRALQRAIGCRGFHRMVKVLA
ncbi:MAG: GNAT family N-acetyltransferase [Anaerolineae bacterium]|jgi:ribosomal protein S18 acetylase RimI-like enzyme|nr:GNAT family N-acetyltransferase [Anaerolineae bacterium]